MSQQVGGRSRAFSSSWWRQVSWATGVATALVLVIPPGAEAAALSSSPVSKFAGAPAPEPDRPDRVSEAVAAWAAEAGNEAAAAMAAARASGEPVEDMSQRTESSSVFANPDGTWTEQLFTAPVRAETAVGVWQDLNEELIVDGGEVRPKVAAVPLEVSGGGQVRGGVSRLATLSAEDSAGRQVSLGLDWPGSLPAPVLDGTVARYAGAGTARSDQARADVMVESLRGGFSHSVVLHERPESVPTYEFPLTFSPGLTLEVAESGALHVVDQAGETVFYAPRPRMWDARIDEVSGDPANVMPLEIEVEDRPSGATLLITPDAKFLADPATVYPVTVDPSWTGVISTDT